MESEDRTSKWTQTTPTAHACCVDPVREVRGRLKPNSTNLLPRHFWLHNLSFPGEACLSENTTKATGAEPELHRSSQWVGKRRARENQDVTVHYSACGSLAAQSGTETLSTFMSLSVYRGRQIKDASHFRGCKSASGDGSGVSDASNPPSAASTYRLPIHVASKATLQTRRIIKCPQK